MEVSKALDGRLALKKLLWQEPLQPSRTAIITARIKEKELVRAGGTNLLDLYNLNVFSESECEPQGFYKKFKLACDDQITGYPNLKKYCDECLELRKDRCKNSLEQLFGQEARKISGGKIFETHMEKLTT
jgi:coproporphyrinogen III oxidase